MAEGEEIRNGEINFNMSISKKLEFINVSGPVIQDGKLVGAVTHVHVNAPTTGYGTFINNLDN